MPALAPVASAAARIASRAARRSSGVTVAVLVGIGPVEHRERRGGRFGERDAAILVRVEHGEEAIAAAFAERAAGRRPSRPSGRRASCHHRPGRGRPSGRGRACPSDPFGRRPARGRRRTRPSRSGRPCWHRAWRRSRRAAGRAPCRGSACILVRLASNSARVTAPSRLVSSAAKRSLNAGLHLRAGDRGGRRRRLGEGGGGGGEGGGGGGQRGRGDELLHGILLFTICPPGGAGMRLS